MAEEVKLYRTWSSPFGLRVVWALNLKHIEYETILEDLTNKSPHLLLYNPVHKKIPVLLHNGKPICESLVIVKGKEQEEGVVEALDNLKLIEEQLSGKKFFGGDNIGFLDIVLGWLANLPSVFEENFYNHPAIVDHWPPRDKMITKFQAILNAIEANK
nr:probable glutathione S-transferase [Ipomoea batatas]